MLYSYILPYANGEMKTSNEHRTVYSESEHDDCCNSEGSSSESDDGKPLGSKLKAISMIITNILMPAHIFAANFGAMHKAPSEQKVVTSQLTSLHLKRKSKS